MKFDCIIVAGGSGTRLGASLPKAFVPLGTKPLFIHSFLKIISHPLVDRIVLVVPPSLISHTQELIRHYSTSNNFTIVGGGKERTDSVKNGIDKTDAEWVLIHDSARPFVSTKTLDDICDLSTSYDAIITAIPEVDTVRKFCGSQALATLDRSEIIRVQTPQLFKRTLLLKGFAHAPTMKTPPTDESMLMEHIGVSVGIAWGDPLNFKVTTPEDMVLAEALIFSKH